jgi:pilus assembly protein Flp/PilA
MTLFTRFLKNESGATAIEYALIAALVGIAMISGLNVLGPAIDDMFNDVGVTLNGTARQ